MNASVADLVIAVANHNDAAAMVEVIHAAFGARPPLDPPSTAVDETSESISDLLAAGGGIYAEVDGQPAGSIVITGLSETLATFQRVSVHPDFQRHGVASAMVDAALSYAAELGFRRVELFARAEFEELIAFWRHRGFALVRSQPHGVILGRALPTVLVVPTAADMHRIGARLAALLRPGDVLIASGELGAGKTTLTQGIAAGLGVRGQVISPTFVISRIHPARTTVVVPISFMSTPTGWPTPQSWTTSTWMRPSLAPSPSSSGERESPRGWPTIGSRSRSSARWRPTGRTRKPVPPPRTAETGQTRATRPIRGP